jgi:hypothetical protein
VICYTGDVKSGSEAELCAELTAEARQLGFVVYPETEGWDLVLVATRALVDRADLRWVEACGIQIDDQIGVQAKLTGNICVLSQCLTTSVYRPHFVAALVDRADSDFVTVTTALGIVPLYRIFKRGKRWQLWKDPLDFGGFKRVRRAAASGLQLPPIVPDLPAGVPSPRSLTTWRLGALRLCHLLRTRGWITAADFAAVKVDRRRWVRQWVKPATTCGDCRDKGVSPRTAETCPSCNGTPKKYYIIAKNNSLPDVGWEAVTEQLRAAGELKIEEKK